jgi:hypothetical protein
MNDQIEPADAARALDEISRRREQVIRRKIFPAWYWWAHGVLMIELTAVVESGHGVLLGIGLALYVACALAIDMPVSRAARAAAPRRGLAGPGAVRRTLLGLATFLVVLIGVCVTTGLSLNAAGVPHPATIAAAVAAVLFALGAPMLVRYETAMLVRRSGSQG